MQKRTTILVGILVALILAYVYRPVWEGYLASHEQGPQFQWPPPPLPGANQISGARVHQDAQGRWFVTFDYFYTGAPAPATLRIELTQGPDLQHQAPLPDGDWIPPRRGQQRLTRELRRPPSPTALTSNAVLIRLGPIGMGQVSSHAPGDVPVSQQLVADIAWPDAMTASLNAELQLTSTDQYMAKTVEMIDVAGADNLREAKTRLAHLLLKQPQLHPAYLELARVAMKTNWGPEGLRQAEAFIDSARQIAAEDPNVWILLGYVYTYQRRYQEAERLFVAAARTNPPNLWLWTNWGELYDQQGKTAQAIQMFQKAVDQPPPGNTYDRARRRAYAFLLDMLNKQKNYDRLEALHKQRFQDYSSVSCYGVEYARFLLMTRGNTRDSIELASQPALAQCERPSTKQVLGLAHYIAWAEAPVAERAELLNRARVYFPSGTRLIYQLATSDRSVRALKELLAAGESIDQVDNRKMTALGYALSNKDHDTAVRLLKLRGRPDFQVGDAGLPVALLPVIGEDYLGIRILRQFGVDYAKLKYQDIPVIDHAKRTGNRKLLDALGGPSSAPAQRL